MVGNVKRPLQRQQPLLSALTKQVLGKNNNLSWGTVDFNHPLLKDNFFKVEAPISARLYLDIAAGQEVAQGQRLGVLKDIFGEPCSELVAAYDGLVLMIVNHPIVNQGEWLISLAPLPEGSDPRPSGDQTPTQLL